MRKILFLVLRLAAHESHTILIYVEPPRPSFRPAPVSPRDEALSVPSQDMSSKVYCPNA